jgi:hypothetical protein
MVLPFYQAAFVESFSTSPFAMVNHGHKRIGIQSYVRHYVISGQAALMAFE